MNKEKWIQALGDFNHLSDLSIEEIESMVKVYPFAQIAHLLLAKKSQILAHPEFNRRLLFASAHHADRAWLYERMNQSELEIKSLKKDKKESNKAKSKKTAKIVSPVSTLEEKPIKSKKQKPKKVSKKSAEKKVKKTKSIIKTSSTKNISGVKAKKKQLTKPEAQRIEKEILISKVSDKPAVSEKKPLDNLKASLARKKKSKLKKPESSTQSKEQVSQESESISEFTSWLLSLDKKYAESIDNSMAENEIADVNNFETTQNKKEIISEPLADLLAEQGHIEKAINMYEKLSLLNPSKSVYFARKIENLKKNNK
jgi:hypothetical protein